MFCDDPMWETEYWQVILAEDQTFLGRGVISLKRRPCTNLSELLEEELLDLQKNVIIPYEAAVKRAFGAEMFNWSCFMNFAYRNTPPDPHVHWHVRPRYRQPVEVAGQHFVDEWFGSYPPYTEPRTLASQEREEIKGKVLTARSELEF